MSDARKLLDALGSVDEKYIEEAAEPASVRPKKRSWRIWGGCVAAAAAVAIGIAALGGGAKSDAVRTAETASLMEVSRDSVLAAAVVNSETEEQEEIMSEDMSEAAAEEAAEGLEEEAAEKTSPMIDPASLVASLDATEFLEKCASGKLTAGAPDYPETSVNPDAAYDWEDGNIDYDSYSQAMDIYYEEQNRIAEETEGYVSPLRTFTETTAKEFLAGQEENTVYSPLNVYMALSMLAELTEGDSRQQLLDLLGLETIEAVREEAKKLWLANYTNDGLTTLLLGSGVWISDQFSAKQEVLDTLVKEYYAFYVSGDMGSETMNQSFRDWLSQQTMGLLDNYISEEKFDPETVLALATTIYYKAHWQDVFQEEATQDAVFHGKSGDETVPFMNEQRSGSYSWGDNFSSVSKAMAGGETMVFVLPDEDASVDEVLAGEQFWDMIHQGDSYENLKYGVIITASIPKFDVSSGVDLQTGLKNLGVSDVFSPQLSDFSPLSDCDGLYVGKVSHNARVKIDEEGVEAAAYTAMMLCGSAMPTDYVDFICDRPFIFVIKNSDGAVLFMGTVNSIQ